MNDIHDLLKRQRVTPRRPLTEHFTNDILNIIGEAPRKRSIAERLHVPVWELQMKLAHLPKVAVVTLAVVAAGTGTAAAYGAYHWLIPRIDILGITAKNDDNKREFAVNIKDCGIMVGGETADNGMQRYEVAPDAHLRDDQVIKVLKTSCQYQQILQFMNDHWHDSNQWGTKPGDSVDTTMPGAGGLNVINDPSIGKVTALTNDSITIASTVYQHTNWPNSIKPGDPVPDPAKLTDFYPGGKTLSRTLALKPDMDVVYNGETVPRGQLQVGDTIMFMSQIRTTVGADGSWVLPGDLKVAHIIKTDIDPAYVQPIAVGNPAIVNAVVRLEGCQGNGDYLCIANKSMQLGIKSVYSYTGNTETSPVPDKRFVGNEKYLRADINPTATDTGKYYHTIEGRILTVGAGKLTLQSRGKTQTFAVGLPYDVAAQFATTGTTLQVGDYIQVMYLQKNGEQRTDIKSTDLYGMTLVMRQQPNGTLKKY